MSFAERLKHARKAKGVTQEELAVMTGCSYPLLSSYERGIRCNPTACNLEAIAEALDVTMDWLWRG